MMREILKKLGLLRLDLTTITRRVQSIERRLREIEEPARASIQDWSNDDYLVVRWLDSGGNELTGDVKVALPEHLRKTPFDGVTLTVDDEGTDVDVSFVYTTTTKRTSTRADSGASEIQVVTPPYWVGSVIEVDRSPRSGTGVATAPDWITKTAGGRSFSRRNPQA